MAIVCRPGTTIHIINPLNIIIMYSMDHCCIENATGTLAQAICKFKNHQEDVQSNGYELGRVERLYELCQQFVQEYEVYDEDKDAYIAEHSEPEDEDEW